MDIRNATILVTGANRGIGEAFVKKFLNEGAKKIYLGVRDPRKVEHLVSQHPDKLVALELDLTNPEHIHRAAQQAKDVNLIINNAGVAFFGSMEDADLLEHARQEMEVNYFGPLALLRSFAPILRENGKQDNPDGGKRESGSCQPYGFEPRWRARDPVAYRCNP